MSIIRGIKADTMSLDYSSHGNPTYAIYRIDSSLDKALVCQLHVSLGSCNGLSLKPRG